MLLGCQLATDDAGAGTLRLGSIEKSIDYAAAFARELVRSDRDSWRAGA